MRLFFHVDLPPLRCATDTFRRKTILSAHFSTRAETSKMLVLTSNRLACRKSSNADRPCTTPAERARKNGKRLGSHWLRPDRAGLLRTSHKEAFAERPERNITRQA